MGLQNSKGNEYDFENQCHHHNKSTKKRRKGASGDACSDSNNGDPDDPNHDDDDDGNAGRGGPVKKPCKATAPVTNLPTPTKPPTDNNQYRQLRLQNGLKVLLISSSADCSSLETPKCAVSLVINVGANDAPHGFEGLPHFCEHLVHMGSKNFPAERIYNVFVRDNHGTTNATTSKTQTNYHFQISQADGFDSAPKLALTMFADFITHPLFEASAICREIESVDNEFFRRKTSTQIRRTYLTHALVIDDPIHPLRKFCTGNKATLMPINVQGNHVTRIQIALRQFHKEHYFSENMSLVVQAKLDLDTLEQHVGAIFQDIPAKSSSNECNKCTSCSVMNGIRRPGRIHNNCAKSKKPTTPYDNPKFNKIISIKPIEEVNELIIFWALSPEAATHTETNPLEYISYVLDSNFPGGVEHYLQERNLISSFSARNLHQGSHNNKYACIFQIFVKLTSKGRNEIQSVCEAIFSYLRLIREQGITKELFTQFQQIQSLHFKYSFSNSSNPLHRVITISKNMSSGSYKDEDILYSDRRFLTFDKQLIKTYADQLIPSKAQFNLCTKCVGRTGFPSVEPLYGTQYLVQDLRKEFLRALENVKIYAQFKLPDWTCWIPPAPLQIIDNYKCEPEVIVDESHLKVLFCPKRNPTPPDVRITYLIKLITPWNMNSCTKAGLASLYKLYIRLIQDYVSQSGQPWFDIGVLFTMKFITREHAIQIYVSGLNYRLQEFVHLVLQTIANFDKKLGQENFRMCKETVVNHLKNSESEAVEFSCDLLSRLKYPEHRTMFELAEKINLVTLESFVHFCTAIKSCITIDAYVMGNATREDAVRLANLIRNKKYFGDHGGLKLIVPPHEKVHGETLLFPIGEKSLRIQALNGESRMLVIHNFFIMGEKCDENIKIAQMLLLTMTPLLFRELRTNQQLGYYVHINLDTKINIGFSILVETHADKFCPCYINSRIDKFLEDLYIAFCKSPKFSKEILDRNRISRSPQEVLDCYAQCFLKNVHDTVVRKISVQVVPCCTENDVPCKKKSPACIPSKWFPTDKNSHEWPNAFILAGPAETTDENNNNQASCGDHHVHHNSNKSANYFITNVSEFQKKCTKVKYEKKS